MKLKKIDIHGFKSFADKTEIIFNEGITGIVGPNGSGKSNIGDAVRWVLGEQSARVLRGSKMEDIIFGGTEKRKAATYCEVTLMFDNEDLKLKSTFTEVSVTRRVYRNGDSEYYLNGTACRLRDILELFRDTGIGREGYSLIGQGRIDEILSVKSEDRRQIFEEAAGVMTFRVRKEEAERKLNRTEENLSRVSDILEELGNRIEPLSKQAETAKEYLSLFAELKSLEINIYLVRHDKLEEKVTSLKTSVETLNDILIQHEALLNQTTENRQKLEEALQTLEEELALCRSDYMGETEAYHNAQSELELEKQKLHTEIERFDRTKQEIEIAEERKNEIYSLFSKGNTAESESKDALEKAEMELHQAQEKLNASVEEADRLEVTLDEHKSAILNAVNLLSDFKNRQARQQTMRDQMKKRLDEIEQSQSELNSKQTELEISLENAIRQSEEVNKRTEQFRQDAASAEGKLRLALEDGNKAQETIHQLNLKLQADRSRLKLMEEMSREMEGYSQSVRKALAYAENDSSVYGVVARLIKVPRELETAIDMALGAQLQNIVTRDEEAAKRMIDHLRINKLGRATFLPMSTVRSRTLSNEERKLLTMPGCIGVASDLINYDDKFRGIIENLLGRTVIAKDLNSGIPIMRAGRHAFRLVTLEGDVMSSGGSMTGGTTQSRAVSLLGREREREELQHTVENNTARLEQLRKQLEQLQNKVEKLQHESALAREQVHQEEIAVAREQERVYNARAELEAHNERIRQTKLAIEQLTDSIDEIDQDLREAEAETGKVAIDREAMDMKTTSLQAALKDAREKVENKRTLLSDAQQNYTEIRHALDVLQRDKERQDKELSQIDSQIAALKTQLESRETQIKVLDEDILERESDLHSRETIVNDKREKVDSLDKQRLSMTQEQRESVEKSESIHKQYDEDQLHLHKTELNLSKAESELKVMSDHIFNEYELTYADCAEFRIENFALTESERNASSIRSRIRELGPINVSAIEDYANTKDRFDQMTAQKDDLLKAKDDLQNLITRLLGQMERQFVEEFDKLKVFFSETFTRLFGGGTAELRLTDPQDALNCGIEIIAQPPGKKLQLLSLLSGGERALTAIAILFAMLKLKPTPFCILDEIEAALDEANIGYYADYMAEFSKGTQFVVVTHRKGTMERCDSLFGVAMQEKGISRMVSVDLKDYE